MKIFEIDQENPDEKVISITRKVLQEGGTVIHATDTCYGIAANIFEEKAIERVFELKKRERFKPISVLFNSLKNIEKYVEIDDFSLDLLNKNLPGPFTFVLKKKSNFPNYFSKDDFLGVRIADCKISRLLSEDYLITTTSANITGKRNPYSIKDIEIEPDLILDSGILPKNLPSTVVKIFEGKIEILRKGGKDLVL